MFEPDQPGSGDAATQYTWRADRVAWPVTTRVGPGLSGVVAEATAVAWLDPVGKRLLYRGVPIEELARSVGFEEVAFLLMTGQRAVDASERWTRFRRQLTGPRYLSESTRCLLAGLPVETSPLDRLRAAISALGGPDIGDTSLATILGRVMALVVAIAEEARGEPIEIPDVVDTIAGRLAWVLAGGEPDRQAPGALDRALIAFADGGLAPPTFASLVVASCHADPYSALVAGMCAAAGYRMDGAATELASLYTRLPDPESARRWVRDTLDAGRPLPGFGHRIFRSGDPRVPVLRGCVEELIGKRDDAHRLLRVVDAIETEGTDRLASKGIGPNVHLHGALVFLLLGAAPDFIPCVMALARLAGAVARMHEYVESNRIFRPLDRYVGVPERAFRRLEDR